MLVAPSGERMLVELKAVDAAYPLYRRSCAAATRLEPPAGAAGQPATAWRSTRWWPSGSACALGRPGADRRGQLRRRRRWSRQEPDKVATPALFGPRALITAGDPGRAPS